MDYALQMQVLGHKLIQTLPNPKNDKYLCWAFEDDDTFDGDLHNLIEGGRRT